MVTLPKLAHDVRETLDMKLFYDILRGKSMTDSFVLIAGLERGKPPRPVELSVRAVGSEKCVFVEQFLEVGTLCDRADYITEMQKRKRPFDRGISSRKGIEY